MMAIISSFLKIKDNLHEMLSIFPEMGMITSAAPFFLEAKTALSMIGIAVSVSIGIVTLMIKLKELKDKYK
jgi:hypothetical protein